MATHRNEQERLQDRKLVLYTAARMFLEKGYEAASVRQIASAAGINVNTMVHDFGAKENILCELVEYVLKGQFSAAKNLLLGMTEDGVLYYAAETALQLQMAECSEAARNLYRSAYSLSLTSELIQRNIAEKLTSVVFREYLPDCSLEDFYRLEIASGSMIWGYMTIPCDADFTIEQKVDCFLDAALRIYRVPEEKIAEAKAFVKRFDYPAIARQTIADMLAFLEKPETEASLLPTDMAM